MIMKPLRTAKKKVGLILKICKGILFISKQILINSNKPLPLQVKILQAMRSEIYFDKLNSSLLNQVKLWNAVFNTSLQYTLLQNYSRPSRSQGNEDSPEFEVLEFHERPFGVNLIGHAFDMFGIGEDIRMTAKSLQSAGIPICVIDHPARNGAGKAENDLDLLLNSNSNGGPYAFNIICMTAEIHARWILESGFNPLKNRFNIAYWPWETQTWPIAWGAMLETVDAIWSSSSFTMEALYQPAKQIGIPISLLPLAAQISNNTNNINKTERNKIRTYYGLPVESILFQCGFDINSSLARKNPMGSIEAFTRAFPKYSHTGYVASNAVKNYSNKVALLIKTFPQKTSNAAWNQLQDYAKNDDRIYLLAENLERKEAFALSSCCDAFLSMHRSEGYGRYLAEALQLGIDVIATNFGGNIDFCYGPLYHPVDFEKVHIKEGEYPLAKGHLWAEPNLNQAVKQMRKVVSRRLDNENSMDPGQNPAIIHQYRQQFSFEKIGVLYKKELERLWSNRKILNEKLRFK